MYYQLFDSKMADGDQLWSVPKLEYDLLRRNASTNGQKTDLIERYILHRKPKQTIYVRYFSILLYLLNVQVEGMLLFSSFLLMLHILIHLLSAFIFIFILLVLVAFIDVMHCFLCLSVICNYICMRFSGPMKSVCREALATCALTVEAQKSKHRKACIKS